MTLAIIMTAVLLAIAIGVGRCMPWLGRLYIPASVIGGLLGLLMLQVLSLTSWSDQANALAAQWKSWPGPLIAVVFAGMLLQRPSSSAVDSLARAGRQGLMVWIIVLGQTTAGLMATWLIIGPIFGAPASFGMLIETGFAGGHGTAAAMGEVFAKPSTANPDLLILQSGLDLGIMMATLGLVYGILSGVFWVNVGVRKGWTRRSDRRLADQQKSRLPSGETVKPQPAEQASDSMDPLLMQAVWLVLAMTAGGCMQWAAGWAAGNFGGASSIVDSFPLFIYTLFGGWIVRKVLTLIGAANLIDSKWVGRISASAMDVLVVAAMASLSLSVLSGNLGGIMVLLLVAALWTSFCLVWLSKRILPHQHWFELGLINYGMSTGTTATGFVLLRLVDPDLESGAAEDYALAAPLSSPFIGGGMITIAMPVLVLQSVPLPAVVLVLVAIMGALVYWGIHTARGQQENADV